MKYIFLGLLILTTAQAKVFIPDGIYISEKCFLRVSTDQNFIHFQFAHKEQHQFEDLPYEDFHPEKVLGTNVIYDPKERRIEFGPDFCGQGSRDRYNIYVGEFYFKTKCHNRTDRVKAELEVKYSQGVIQKLAFYEKGQQDILFDFSCYNLMPELTQ